MSLINSTSKTQHINLSSCQRWSHRYEFPWVVIHLSKSPIKSIKLATSNVLTPSLGPHRKWLTDELFTVYLLAIKWLRPQFNTKHSTTVYIYVSWHSLSIELIARRAKFISFILEIALRVVRNSQKRNLCDGQLVSINLDHCHRACKVKFWFEITSLCSFR